MPDPAAEQTDSPTWWNVYFHPTPSRKSYVPIRNPGQAIAIPLAILFLSVSSGLFWVTSNSEYIDRVMSEAREQAAARGQLEAFENVEAMTRNAIQNPAVRASISLQSGWITVRSFLLFMALSWILLSMITSSWKSAIPFASLLCVSSGIFCAGAFFYATLRYLFGGELVFLGPVQLLDSFDRSNPLHLLSARADLFFFWFLAVASVRASALYRERLLTTITIFIGAWMILFSISFLLDQSYYFLP